MSLLDMYVDTSEPTDTVGQIQFSLEYDFSTSTLILKIYQVTLVAILLVYFKKI
jgi:hypothetical protein